MSVHDCECLGFLSEYLSEHSLESEDKLEEEGDVEEKAICVKEVNGAKQCYVENDVKANF